MTYEGALQGCGGDPPGRRAPRNRGLQRGRIAGGQGWPIMVTTKDIAIKLGFSVSTIGRALSGDPRISEKTKQAVRNAAEELGYVGNLPARMMRGGSSNLIGLILPDIQNDFFASIAQALSESCDREGYRIVLSITGDDPETEMRHIRDFVGARVAGIILVPSAGLKREGVALLRQVPHVQLLRYASGPDDLWFGIDDNDAMERAASHLLDLGHRRIAYVAASERLSTGRRRLEGVHEAYRKRDIAPEALTVCLGTPTATWGERAVNEVLAMPERPTAILSGSAHVTMGIIAALRRARVDIPDQMSVIGFGDPNWSEWWQPPITVIRPPIQSLATNCALWFMDRLRTPGDQLVASYHAISSSELVLRSSTGRPAGD